MTKTEQAQTRKPGRPSRYEIPLTEAARVLQISKGHLDKVLKGERKSVRLSSKYQTLVFTYKALRSN
jgi:DNA-directed RNA polymerase subunit K/omega